LNITKNFKEIALNFIETRGNDGSRPARVSFSEAILNPMASYGGLYAPETLPDFGVEFLSRHIDSDYKKFS